MVHYDIRVIEVGYTDSFPADFTFDGYYMAGETMFSPFCMTLIQGGGKNILVDCGIDLSNPVKQEIYKAAGAENGHTPGEALAAVGLAPEDIDAVIITHLHWDHVGGAACYPGAVFYLQKEELDRWTEVAKDHNFRALSLLSMDYGDLATLRELEDQGRLVLLDGEKDDLFPGISIRVSLFAHSFAQQMVLVEDDLGVYIIAGDVCNRPENLIGTDEFAFFLPNPKFAVGGAYNAVKDYKRIMEWMAGDLDRVVMTHDGTRRTFCSGVEIEPGLAVYDICT